MGGVAEPGFQRQFHGGHCRVKADSDQGKSFRAFWDFLLSSRRQEELTELLDRVLALPAVADLNPDTRTRRVHFDWMEAGEHTQRTVAALSQQLRRSHSHAAIHQASDKKPAQ